jgi:Spy/CpxP family protein refolding chaperone
MSILPRALSLSLLLVVALATASSARPPWGRGQAHGPGGLLEEHVDQLGLDEETREAIRDVVRESRESSEELRDELRGLHREMKRALSQDAPDESAVMLLADRIGMLETSLHKHRLAAMLAIRSALTPEQREQLAELREEERGRHLEPLADACRDDALRLCPTAEGRFERMQCMREHRDEVSDACREALHDLRRERRHKRWGGGG